MMRHWFELAMLAVLMALGWTPSAFAELPTPTTNDDATTATINASIGMEVDETVTKVHSLGLAELLVSAAPPHFLDNAVLTDRITVAVVKDFNIGHGAGGLGFAGDMPNDAISQLLDPGNARLKEVIDRMVGQEPSVAPTSATHDTAPTKEEGMGQTPH
ncbi:MAG TPA: hypothetical protein DEP63_04195 [Candidatus Magasanikbacteria bacterium]|nr:hypothetical protein [Candidatus Magasanikbacteria bacterium]HCC13922.1 hypothetical protein [Candidatus Magasanikbacteria bacterium]HCM54009.1 hypothetical protein [Candidatus Magasanikbacteria bacterium]